MEKEKFIAEEVLRQIASGDQKGFRVFYEATYPLLFRFAYYFLADKKDCEEVVSDIYFSIWKQKEYLLSIRDLKAWLYIVCRNEAFHFIKQKRRYANISIDDLPIELSIDANSADGQLIEKEVLHSYNEAIAGLPERCKLIFLMVREEHLKHKEIAKILSIKEGTVEQQMNIAIRKLIAAVHKTHPVLMRRNKIKVKEGDPFVGESNLKTLTITNRKRQL